MKPNKFSYDDQGTTMTRIVAAVDGGIMMLVEGVQSDVW